MNAQELISVPVNRKEQIESAAATVIEQINNGLVNPLLTLANIKSWEKVFEKIKEDVIVNALRESEKYPEKEILEYGVKFEKMEAGVSYDYKSCNHPAYERLCNQIEELNVKKKQMETMLRSIDDHATLIDEATGEVVTIYPPSKKSTTTIKVTIK